ARVQLDQGLLRELVVNLLLAAADRMPEGGVVKVSSRRDGAFVELRVTDGGKPYSPEERVLLFDPLKGAAASPQRSLLLAVGRNQVQRWGGELNCESGEVGSEFRVRLPVAAAPVLEVPPAPAEARAPHEKPKRVLVVDDDPDNALMMAQVLADEGYEAKVANSGAEALALWETRRFDAALLDALMPGMSGWELARELRQRSPEVLLAMVTGADIHGMNRANLALVDSVFRKPVDIGALDEFLSRRERRKTEEQPGHPG
ncbi:MAG: response regulator, partial [Myxococcaceae bacterium]